MPDLFGCCFASGVDVVRHVEDVYALGTLLALRLDADQRDLDVAERHFPRELFDAQVREVVRDHDLDRDDDLSAVACHEAEHGVHNFVH